MNLSKAARRFDSIVCRDAYDIDATPFKGQTTPFDDSRGDGASVERRIFEVAPEVDLPERMAINFDGQNWLVGQMQTDNWLGRVLRRKFTVQFCSGLGELSSFAGILAGDQGFELFAERMWVKNEAQIETSSELFDRYDIHTAKCEDNVVVGALLRVEGRLHLIRSVHASPGGFSIAVSDELPTDCLSGAIHRSTSYDPIQDIQATTDTDIQIVKIRWQAEFSYLTEASSKYAVGDMHGVVLADVDAKAGDKIVVDAIEWTVQSRLDAGATLGLHLRRS